MSLEDAYSLFKYGFDALVDAKTNATDYSNHANVLIQATHTLDQAVDLIEEEDPCYVLYSHVCASAHACCLLLVDFSAELDKHLASSLPLQTMLTVCISDSDDGSAEPLMDEAKVDIFWDQLEEFQDNSFKKVPHDLLSNRALASHVSSYDRARSNSLKNPYLGYMWSTYCATALYLGMDRGVPENIALCVVSMRRAIQLGNPGLLIPSDTDPTLLQVVPESRDVTDFRRRLSWLEPLTIVHIYLHAANFKKSLDLFKSNSDPADLDECIVEARRALAWGWNTGLQPKLHFRLLRAVGLALHARYNLNYLLEDLEDSAEYIREALTYDIASADQLLFCRQFLSTITADLANRFAEDLKPETWLKSLSFWRESITLTELTVPELLAERLFQLSRTASNLYQRSDAGDMAHISEAIECLARAASLTSSLQFRSEILFLRAEILYTRFVKEARSQDLDESIDSGAEACRLTYQVPGLIEQTPQVNGIYRHGVNFLRSIQQNRTGAHTRSVEQIQQFIEFFEPIVALPHVNQLRALGLLGKAYTMLYQEQVEDGQTPVQCVPSLTTAAKYHQIALQNIRQDNALSLNPHHMLFGIVNHQLSRIPGLNTASRAQYLELAIDHLRRANHTKSISNYRKLAIALEDRYKILRQPGDLNECVSLLQAQATHGGLVGHPSQFFMTALQLVRICREYKLTSRIIPAYRFLFKTLRRLSHWGMTSAARYQALVNNSTGHACDAASAALTLKDPESAIELLEEGRSLFFSQLLPTQIDTNKIRALDAQLATDLEYTLARVLEYSTATDADEYEASQFFYEGGFAEDIDQEARDISSQSTKLMEYAQRLDEYIMSVRKLPGYGSFMQFQPFSSLRNAAKHCPVVYINVSQYRCDAIILRRLGAAPELSIVPLAISWSQIHQLSRTMQETVRLQGREVRDSNIDHARSFVRAHRTTQPPAMIIQNVLKQLWECVVHPVLLSLDFLRGLNVASQRLPHICWCLTGPAATFLPFHAAGNYELGPEHWAATHVVSSYTPTLSSLIRATERSADHDLQKIRMLLVSQPACPSSSPLPYVNQERDGIVSTMRGPAQTEVSVLHDSSGRIVDVKAMLPSHNFLHLACHGKQDKSDPLNSAILLFDGDISLREIIKMPLPSAELVYLSACQTATGDIESPDESLSLAGGFLFAGYRTAVATMWSIDDKDGAEVAKMFYKYFLDKQKPAVMGAAWALHCAVRDLRLANPNMSLIRWIPFMCWGISGTGK